MESWSCVAGGNGSASNEVISDSDSFGRSKNGLFGWDMRSSCSFANNMFFPSRQAVDTYTYGFEDFGVVEGMVGEQLASNSNADTFKAKNCKGRNVGPVIDSANAFSGEEESSSKLSGSVVESNCRDSPLIDLKLGGIIDDRGARILSSPESCTPAKRARVTGSNIQSAFCQVYGCNKDLSSSKEYHKRHRVCEAHSKTSRVIVNGIEQRFCQQCSRFHLLAEFDDGKRSCRKRLAGHNERRRKPHLGAQSARTGRLLHSYTGRGYAGNHFRGSLSAPSPFMLHNAFRSILPPQPQSYGVNGWSKRVKVEDGLNSATFTGPAQSSEPDGFESHFPSFNGSRAKLSTYNNRSQDPGFVIRPSPGSLDILRETSLGSQEFGFSDAASTLEGLSEMSDSGCALSLLSSRSHSSSSHYNPNRVSQKVEGLSSRGLVTSHALDSNAFSMLNSSQGNYSVQALVSEDHGVADFGMANGIYQSSEFSKPTDDFFCEDGSTIDLLQLSSQLQRVEHQRRSMKNPGSSAYCGLQIT